MTGIQKTCYPEIPSRVRNLKIMLHSSQQPAITPLALERIFDIVLGSGYIYTIFKPSAQRYLRHLNDQTKILY